MWRKNTGKLKQFKVEKRLRKSLTQEELELLREACVTERQKAMLEFMFTTGCRLAEIVNVKISDINWGERCLKVIGKGNKERFVYITVKCRILLTKYINSRKDCNEFLFVSKNKPYAKLGGRTLEREIGKIAENAKINKPVFPHIIRHTMATVSLNNGMSITTVQLLLGHESPETTLIYAELNEETIKQEYKKLN